MLLSEHMCAEYGTGRSKRSRGDTAETIAVRRVPLRRQLPAGVPVTLRLSLGINTAVPLGADVLMGNLEREAWQRMAGRRLNNSQTALG